MSPNKREFDSAFSMEVTPEHNPQRPTFPEWFEQAYGYAPIAPRRSWFAAMKAWATAAVAVANPFTICQRVTAQYAHFQQIIAVPVPGGNGFKKRLIDAFGLRGEDRSSRFRKESEAMSRYFREYPSPSERRLKRTSRSRTQRTRSPQNSPVRPLPWNLVTPPSTPSIHHESRAFSTEDQDVTLEDDIDFTMEDNADFTMEDGADFAMVDDADLTMEEDVDISLDFSFSDLLTSTPPRNLDMHSPMAIAWDSPSIYASSSPTPSAMQPSTPQPNLTLINWTSPSIYASASRLTFDTTPNPVTPVRENLLKQQLRRSAELSDIEEETSFEIANESVHAAKDAGEDFSDLSNAPSSPFESDVESPIATPITQTPSPMQSDDNSSPFQSDVGSSPFQSYVGSPTPAHGQVYENDLSFLDDASPLPLRRTVRWAQHARAKPFYFDEGVSEMLDSTLETITSSLEEAEMSAELRTNLEEEVDSSLPPGTSQIPQRGLVTPLDTSEMDFLDNMAEATEFGKDAEYSIVDDKLKARDFATLLPSMFNGDPKAWLNDNIVNEYLSILVNYKKRDAGFEHKRAGPAPPVHAFSSFWYTNVKKNVQSVSRWASRFQLAGAQYLDAELVLYPICDSGHWRLIAVKPKIRSIEYYDSLGYNGKPYIAKVLEYLRMELKDAFIADEWTVVEKQRSSRQLNGSDCGVFTVLNALALLRGEDVDKVIACDGMNDARERIATTLMAGVPTEME